MIVLLEKKYSKNLLAKILGRKSARNFHHQVTSAKGWINFAKNGELTPEQVRVMAADGTVAIKNNLPIYLQTLSGAKKVKAGESPEVIEYVKRLRDLARNGQGY